MAKRYEALLTERQVEILGCADDSIITVPGLYRCFAEVNPDFGMLPFSRESLYASVRTLEARGLLVRNPGYTWPIEFTATEDGQKALDIAESSDILTPSRRNT